MANEQATPVARDGEELHIRSGGQEWIGSWHTPVFPPTGKSHGSAAICFTSGGNVVLVSIDGENWDFPAGRPEGDEDWRATLDREVLEEACASVEGATLLGFCRTKCVQGPEKGMVLVRSMWRAAVSLREWEPRHEIRHRLVVPSDTALEKVEFGGGRRPFYQRWFQEALATS